jgi:hypothetical protein
MVEAGLNPHSFKYRNASFILVNGAYNEAPKNNPT